MARSVASWRLLSLLVGVSSAASASFAQTSSDGAFTLVPEVPANVLAQHANVRPAKFQAVRVDWAKLEASLSQAPLEDAGQPGRVIELPMPDGSLQQFSVLNSPVMEAPLAAAFPQIRTYIAQGIDQPAATARLDATPQGFHAQILSPDGAVYIDPVSGGNLEFVASYLKSDYQPRPSLRWSCDTPQQGVETPAAPAYGSRAAVSRKTFRLAVCTTGEYTEFHSALNNHPANVVDGLAAVTTAVNRMTGIYEQDLGVRLVLVGSNNQLIFINPATDPFSNTFSSAERDLNHTVIVQTIGQNAFDAGMLLSTADGGIAFIGAVCTTAHKGKCFAGFPEPINDPFVVDYAAHELGHQFGGRHNFNNCGGAPGDSFDIAYEPGSGSTIMCYAGICGATDLQAHSDPMFGAHSIEAIRSIVSGSQCGTLVATTNNPPAVTGGPTFTIPFNTPYALTPGSAVDPDGDPMTFSWEQRDTTTVPVAIPLTDNGANPLSRVFPPSLSQARIIPRLSNLLANTLPVGEMLPGAGRTLHYRVVVRDNVAGAGGVAWADKNIVVNPNIGPFRVTAPNTAVNWQGTNTVTWAVNGTAGGSVNAPFVRILLSTDGGLTFPTVLVASTANDGTEAVPMPDINTTTARIKIEAINNIFFDVSDVNFTIRPRPAGVAFAGTGVNVLDDSEVNGNNNGSADPGENNLALFVQIRNDGRTTATNVRGTLTLIAPVPPGASIVNTQATYPDMPTDSPGSNNTPFRLALSNTFACGSVLNFRLTVNSTQGSSNFNFSLPTGLLFPEVEHIFDYAGPELVIPDYPGTGVTATITATALPDIISRVAISFPGDTCNTDPGSDTVGISHTYISDLYADLQPPAAFTTVTQPIVLMNRPGTDNPGNNMCNTTLTDTAGSSVQDILAGDNPFSSAYRPTEPLDVLSNVPGSRVAGDWTLYMEDDAGQDVGVLYHWRLSVFTRQVGRFCQSPVVCQPDLTQDGNVDQDDVSYLVNIIAGGPNPLGADPDFNHDGNADQDDIAALINVVAGAPCP